MTRHLSPQEFVDAADAVLPADRLSHLDRCVECRQELDALRRVMTDLGPARDVPDPSPLFWEHFTGRVRATADAEPARERPPWPGWQPLALGAVVVVAAVLFVFRPGVTNLPQVDRTVVNATPPPVHLPDTSPVPVVTSPGAAAGDPTDDTSPEATRSWGAVVEAGKAASVEQVHDVSPVGPSTALLIEDLSQRELREFARLLRAQMGGLQ
jgi:hypothetical protein